MPESISYGEGKRKQLLKSFGINDDLEKGGKLDTSHLVLKEINVNGKVMHRWVDPNKDNKEHAQYGSKVEFDHKGSKVKGTVGGVQKTGEYAIRGEDGKVYNKHPHQFESPHKEDEEKIDKQQPDKQGNEPKQQDQKSLTKLAKEASDKGLAKTIKEEDDPNMVKIAKQELQRRKDGGKQVEPKNDEKSDQGDAKDDDQEDSAGENGETDINRRFKTFERFVKAVAKGRMKSLITYGTGGVGKTYTVTDELKKLGKKEFKEGMEVGSDDYDYVKITGKATPAAVYQALYEHNGKIIIFDDCDSVLQHEDAINLFKGALDTSGDGTINYGSQTALKDSNGNPMPKRFSFNGRVMFISNLPPNKVPQPLKSRSLRIDMTMTPEQTIERMRTIAKDKDGNYQNLQFPGLDGKPIKYTHEDMESAINFLDKYKNKTSDLNVRTIGSIISIIHEASEEGDDDWQHDAKAMLFSKALSDDLQKAFKHLDIEL